MMYYRNLEPYAGNRFFFGAPLLGGFIGGLIGGGIGAGIGSAVFRPRPFYPYPVPYGGVPYGYGAPYGFGAPYGVPYGF
ncbi:hypothetical protein D4T97_004095 [Siminovitchia acidinfaciens]|uniref:Uncharacterized protein n=1 Tax=Siminovitchia acidinfaciens TaxID=2321395 RepID=A0A429Y8C5_9BACI|nr:hypothetical protein [Siminovitchia acidinfaciens]RST77660.1 hypothetical protein D4T97_004095 [Siminovitchia acidinfaciens]